MLLTSTPLSDHPPSIKLILGANRNKECIFIYTGADGGTFNRSFPASDLISPNQMTRFKLITQDNKIELSRLTDNKEIFKVILEERDMFFMNSIGISGIANWIFHNDALPPPETTVPPPTSTVLTGTTYPSSPPTTPIPSYDPDKGNIQLETKSSLYANMSMVSEAFVAQVTSCNETEIILSRFAKSAERDFVKIIFGQNFITVECPNCREKNKTHTESDILVCSRPFTFWVKFEESVEIIVGRGSTIDSDILIKLDGKLPYGLDGLELHSKVLASWIFQRSSGKKKYLD